MKKIVTIALVAMLAVSCLFALAACTDETAVLADTEYEYIITGAFNGWGVPMAKCPDCGKELNMIDTKYLMKPIAVSDERVASIKKELKDVEYLYIIEHTVLDSGAGWDFGYALTEGAEKTMFDGNQAIKVIKTHYETVDEVSAWTSAWIPNAGDTTVKSLTPDTLYMPPHSEAEPWTDSGHWNSNPAVLKAGDYYIVFAVFSDGTFGLGAIAK